MIGLALNPSIPARFAVVLSAAMALLLPAPARCDGCGTGKTNCPHCVAAVATAPIAPARPCCQNHTANHRGIANPACEQVRTAPCSCCIRPADRAWAPAETQISTQEILAALPAGQPLQLSVTSASIAAVAALADLPPPVPHRILHCSWII